LPVPTQRDQLMASLWKFFSWKRTKVFRQRTHSSKSSMQA
jgi:hypothetical protein